MFKKLSIVLLVISVVFPITIQARSISGLKSIKLVSYEEINEQCHQPSGYDSISGCYFPNEGISIRNDLPKERFIFVFWHELGHFFMENTTDEQYKMVFNPTPQKLLATIISEIAADTFALWMMGGKVPEAQRQFFIKLLIQ